MSPTLSHSLLADFSQFIATELGLYFPRQKWRDLEKGIQSASKAFQFDDAQACIQWLMSSSLDQRQIEILASFLTVGETYFFRDPGTFEMLQKVILPPLIYQRIKDNQKRLRIWSAGCASGEEACSIAIVLHKLLPDIPRWNITLLATDINTIFLNKLATGVYSEWSFRGVNQEMKSAYFNKTPQNKYEILPGIKELVQPAYLNLAQDTFPSLLNNTNAMDIIFCRNVMMYFSPELFQQVVARFYDCLVDGGCLIVSPGEVNPAYFKNFKIEFLEGVTVFRKKIPDVMTIPTPQPEPRAAAVLPVTVKAPPVTPVDYRQQTLEYANLGKLQEALECSHKAISANKMDAELHYMRAMILLELNQDQEAEAALKRVLYLEQDHILANMVLGNVYQRMKKQRAALKHFDHALLGLSRLGADALVGDMTVRRLVEVIRSSKELVRKV